MVEADSVTIFDEKYVASDRGVSRASRPAIGLAALLVFFGVPLTSGCSPRGPLGEPGPAAGHSSRVPERAIEMAVTLAKAEPQWSQMLAPTADGWRQEGGWATSPGWRAADRKRFEGIGARLPERADGTREVGLSRFERFRLSITPQGSSGAATLMVNNGRAVVVDAWPSTDVVLTASESRLEEFLVLKDETAPKEFAWKVDLPRGIKDVRQERDGGLTFADAKGEMVMRMPPAVAVDAEGMRRQVELGWSDGRLALRMIGPGAYPVLVDPALETAVWTQQSPVISPSARYRSQMAYDSRRNVVVLFSGNVCTAVTCSSPGDTWEWDGTNWTQLSPLVAPPGRYSSALAYDPTRQRIVLFGGRDNNLPKTYADTWEWDGTNWTLMSPATAPSAREDHALAFDGSRVVLFGGSGNADTWLWDGSVWTTASPATVPSARDKCSMLYDPNRGKAILFGGWDYSIGPLSDTWEWDGTTWTQLSPATQPPARDQAALAYDNTRNAVVLFGGYNNFSNATFGDTWEWNGSDWRLMQSSIAPAPRLWHVLTHDVAHNTTILFGGLVNGGSVGNDTWEYHTRGGACTTASQCDTGACVDSVCCESQSCNTCMACDTATNPGVCSPVTNAQDLDTCAGANTCGPKGQCGLPNAQPCTTPGQCASRFCADSVCCDTACSGSCDACNGATQGWVGAIDGVCANAPLSYAGSPSCGAYSCDGTNSACATSCTTDAQCAASFYCAANGTCQARVAQAGGCNPVVDCQISGCRECAAGTTCKDGYCCGSACAGTCQTCSATPGTCTALKSADDVDTCTGTNTCDVAGTCKLRNGQSCTGGGPTCASGYCSDGYCCNTACAGSCDTCSAVPGTCTIVASGSAGANPSCAPYVCGGNAGCPASCSTDANCAIGFYCSANGACIVQKSQGATCNDAPGADCQTAGCRVCVTGAGKCSEGFCCDTACGGACDACDGAVKGWSGAVNGTCSLAPVGNPGTPMCGAYACTGTSATCAGTTCASDTQCGVSSYCDKNGTCQTRKSQGAVCSEMAGADCLQASCRVCATGTCKDGYCCDSSCSGPCQTCSATPGTCTPVTGTDDSPECAGATTCNVSGLCKKKVAQTCTGASDCASGFCADSYCCDKSCAGGCDLCDATPGTCTLTVAGSAGTNPSCAPSLCSGTSPNCPGGCTSDSDCASTHYCSSAGSCVQRKVIGTTCDPRAGGDCGQDGCRVCVSGHCVDGYCCDSACAGNCDACAASLGAATNGTCAPIPMGAPGGPACNPYVCDGVGVGCPVSCAADSDCAGTHYCGADKTCKPRKAQAAQCSDTVGADCLQGGCRVCSTGHCSDGVCCDQACGGGCDVCRRSLGGSADGICAILSKNTPGSGCGAYLCDGLNASCPGAGACQKDGDCATGSYCDVSNACRDRKQKGLACTQSHECAAVDTALSGFGYCVDGVCCDGACSNGCSACTAALKASGRDDGTCGPAKTGTDPHDTCEATQQSSCGKTGNCNGAGDCQLWPQNTSCGGTFCKLNDVTGKVCSGNGVCVDVSALPCTPYLCQNAGCTSPCASSAQCDNGYYCVGGSCLKKQDPGHACAGGDECQAGFCVDGVCCDSPCGGQCEACALSGHVGVCSPVTGTPIAPRAACVGVSPCKGACNGGDRTACVFPDQATSCGQASCMGDVLTLDPRCDGAGQCAAPRTQSCVPSGCDPVAKACIKTCTKDGDCAAGATCDIGTGKCAVTDNTCKDVFTVISPGGSQTSCAPYRCVAGACQQQCVIDADCATGYTCNASACMKQDAGSSSAVPDGSLDGSDARIPAMGSRSGCGCMTADGEHGPSDGNIRFLVAIALFAAAGRRRRSPASRTGGVRPEG